MTDANDGSQGVKTLEVSLPGGGKLVGPARCVVTIQSVTKCVLFQAMYLREQRRTDGVGIRHAQYHSPRPPFITTDLVTYQDTRGVFILKFCPFCGTPLHEFTDDGTVQVGEGR